MQQISCHPSSSGAGQFIYGVWTSIVRTKLINLLLLLRRMAGTRAWVRRYPIYTVHFIDGGSRSWVHSRMWKSHAVVVLVLGSIITGRCWLVSSRGLGSAAVAVDWICGDLSRSLWRWWWVLIVGLILRRLCRARHAGLVLWSEEAGSILAVWHWGWKLLVVLLRSHWWRRATVTG